MSIVGGHTELTPGLERPIVITTAFSFAKSFVSAADAQEGDSVMMTKSAGVEGTAILANSLAESGTKLDARLVRRAQGFLSRMSVVAEADAAFRTGFVHAMHDCTEGGVLGSIYEMAIASGLGFEISEAEIPVASETSVICAALGANPLKLIGSGALLLAVKSGKEAEVKRGLKAIGRRLATIGTFGRGGKVLVHRNGLEEELRTAATDEIWRLESRLQVKRGLSRHTVR